MISAPASETRLHGALSSPEETERLAQRMATALKPGDFVALCGPLGAGKSLLARAAIRSLTADPDLEVPSPSYTLVNVYSHGDAEIWHADLYRLGEPDEMTELGMMDAIASSILFVEWADRLADLPERHLMITLDPRERDTRDLVVEGVGTGWEPLFRALRESA